MRNQKRLLSPFLLSLALAVPTVFVGAAPAQALVKDRPQPQDRYNNDDWNDEDSNVRFEEMDTNGDGRVTRSEWRGNDRSFDVHDWNRDGVLSGNELRPGNRDDRSAIDRFDRLDRNNDGYVSLSEWPRDRQTFDLLDRNDDGRLSQSELADRTARREIRDERFAEMDTNRDGRLSRSEWTRGEDSFERLDRDNDGYVTRDELQNRAWDDRNSGLYPRDERRFQDLDRNRDNRLSRTEWTGSSDLFDRLDRNDDGYLSLNEWLGR
jgi:Ca2+-binding EF-hand superfamily protein